VTESTESNSQLITELMHQFMDMLIVVASDRAFGFPFTKEAQEAFRSVPRHLFVDQYYDSSEETSLIRVDPENPTADQLEKVYSDQAITTHLYRGAGTGTSSTSQPSLVANMLEKLQIKPGMKVLEIGAGTGWNAALMGHLVGSDGHVYSIDIQSDVARRARRHIRRLGSKNVNIITLDGGYGYPKEAPYDRIITTVACPDISPHWIDQLKSGGLLLITLQDIPGQMACLLASLWKQNDHLSGKIIGWPYFMTLQGRYGTEHGTGSVTAQQVEEQLEGIKAGRKQQLKYAPWRSWPFRRWLRQDLLFFAYLEGLSVEPTKPEVEDLEYILRSKDSESICVTGEEQIELYSGDESYRVFTEITRKWIELGAPKRDSYLLEVWPKGVEKRPPKNGWLVQREHSQLIFRLE
jgi:protein-L-isoaspartate(D-aspartate) O-methyltransferase